MATPEAKVKDKIKAVLKHFGAYYHMPVTNGMGKPSLDFICCYKGKFFGIEAKAPGKVATARQEQTMDEMEAAGGKCFVVNCPESLKLVIDWLQHETFVAEEKVK